MFYTAGGVCLAWCLAWFFLVTDDPETHPFVSHQELAVIQANRVIPEKKGSLRVPLLSILSSTGVWAVIMTSLANDYGLYLMLTEGPSFLLNVLKKDVKEVSYTSS